MYIVVEVAIVCQLKDMMFPFNASFWKLMFYICSMRSHILVQSQDQLFFSSIVSSNWFANPGNELQFRIQVNGHWSIHCLHMEEEESDLVEGI